MRSAGAGDVPVSRRRHASCTALNAHDSYLINLASPDAVLRARSLESFVCELRRCEALGLDALVSHPGNFMDDRRVGSPETRMRSWRRCRRVPGRVRILLETTAGSGHGAWRHVRGAGRDHRARAETTAAARGCVHRHVPHLRGRVRHRERLRRRHGALRGYRRLRSARGDAPERLEGSARLQARPARAHRRRGDRPSGVPADHDGRPARRTCPKLIETPKLDEPEVTDRRMLELLRSYANG